MVVPDICQEKYWGVCADKDFTLTLTEQHVRVC